MRGRRKLHHDAWSAGSKPVELKTKRFCNFKGIFSRGEIYHPRMMYIQDQSARSVKSDLDLHCPLNVSRSRFERQFTQQNLGLYSPTILKKVICLFLQDL